MSVVETEVNGKLSSSFLIFKYVLADGREIEDGDFDPDFKETMTKVKQEEVMNLLREMEFEVLDTEEKEVRGRVFVFTRQRFILSDGTEVIKSVGRPK